MAFKCFFSFFKNPRGVQKIVLSFDEDVFQHDCTQHLFRFTYKSLYQQRTVALSSSNF